MKGNKVKDKAKEFVKKHERVIKRSVAAITFVTVVFTVVANKDKIGESLEDDSLTEEEWDHLFGLARQMDDYVAERKALKSQ